MHTGQLNKKIILDVNILLDGVKFKIDVLDEIRTVVEGEKELMITKQVRAELEKLKKRNKNIAVVEKILKRDRVREMACEGKNADDSLVNCAKKGMIIATNDAELKRRVKEVGGNILYLRKKHFIEMI